MAPASATPESIQQAPAPQVTALGLANEPIAHKVGVLFYRLCLCTSPFSVHHSLMNGGPLSGAGLKKATVPDVGFKPFSSGRSSGF